MNFDQLAAEYGALVYGLIFGWTFLEGETFVIFAGFAAHQGYLDWWLVFLSAWTGSFAGDQFYFWVGRRWGPALLERFPRWQPCVAGALDWLRRFDTWFILSFRFIYGVRNFASFAMGLSGVKPLRFAALNFVAAGSWAVSFTGFGYVFGRACEAIMGDLVDSFGFVMLGVFLAGIGILAVVHRRQQRRFAALRVASAPVVSGDGASPPV